MIPTGLIVAGKEVSGWTSVEITRSLTSLCGGFGMAQAAVKGSTLQHLPIYPGDWVEIYVRESIVMEAWVDKVSPKIGPTTHELAVEGREVTCDLVDCGVLDGPHEWKNVTIPQLARILLQPFNLTFSDEGSDPGAPFPRFSAEPGDTVFSILQKAASMRGLLLTTNRKGAVTLLRGGDRRSTDRLVYGENVLSASAGFDNRDRFSTYAVRGTATPSPGAAWLGAVEKMHVEGRATDPGITRYRPAVIVSSGDTSRTSAKTRASWEATTRAARAGSVEVVVPGWEQSDGTLWDPGMVTPVQIPALFGPESRDLLISQVRQTLGAGGTISTLSLVDPLAFNPEPQKGKKTSVPVDPWATIRKAVRG